jgi:hypothetical protein
MKKKQARILYIRSGSGSPTARITIPREVIEECGIPERLVATYIGPGEFGGPKWTFRPEVVK